MTLSSDECGHWHASGLKYNWFGLSVLNEDEHALAPDQGQMYTTCFDAIKAEVTKNNPSIISVGPELCWVCTKDPLSYMKYFLNASNHDDGLAPPITSYHVSMKHPRICRAKSNMWLHVLALAPRAQRSAAGDSGLTRTFPAGACATGGRGFPFAMLSRPQ